MESIALGKTMTTFVIESNSYFQPYLLVDGIYPKFTCFVGPCSNPVTVAESNFSRRQESQRKDIERAFGALQIKYKIILMLYDVPAIDRLRRYNILNRPSLTPDAQLMRDILKTCVIL
jgi:hypothetical protein